MVPPIKGRSSSPTTNDKQKTGALAPVFLYLSMPAQAPPCIAQQRTAPVVAPNFPQCFALAAAKTPPFHQILPHTQNLLCIVCTEGFYCMHLFFAPCIACSTKQKGAFLMADTRSPFAELSFSEQQERWRVFRAQALAFQPVAQPEEQPEPAPVTTRMQKFPPPSHKNLDRVRARIGSAVQRTSSFQPTSRL